MTPAELRQIDAQVAAKVMGKDERFCKIEAECDSKWSRNYLPFYTSNKEAAMEVLEKCVKKLKGQDAYRFVAIVPSNSGWIVQQGCKYDNLWCRTEAETLPLAICIFALEVFK